MHVVPSTSNMLLRINIPKLVHGEGSLTKLEILNNGSGTHYDNYAGVVIYDQGSSLAGLIAKPTSTSSLQSQVNMLYLKWNNILLLPYIGIFFWLFLWLFWYRRRQRRSRFMIQIKDSILSIYHSLNESPMSDITFDKFIEQWNRKVIYGKKYTSYNKYIITSTFVEGLNKHISPKDYIHIDKLYTKLRNRKPNLTGDELKTYNNDCARLAENALTRIPWKNYI